MEWLFGVIGFVLGVGLTWLVKSSSKLRVDLLGVISPGTITCVSSTRLRVPFTAIPAPEDLSDGYIVRAKTYHGSTVPTWENCASVGSSSPFECDITSSADDRIVMYAAFRRPGGSRTALIPSCSSGGSDSSEAQSVLP